MRWQVEVVMAVNAYDDDGVLVDHLDVQAVGATTDCDDVSTLADELADEARAPLARVTARRWGYRDHERG